MKTAALSIAVTILLSGPGVAQDVEEFHRRADEALQGFLLDFWRQDLGYLEHEHPGASGPTGYWTFAQGFDALLDGVERTDGKRYAGLIETFHAAQDARGWIVSHYDDEAWMALALIRAHDLTGEAKYLDRAVTLYADIESAWNETCCGSRPGGIWWDKAHTQKATASNAAPVILAARLHERTGNASQLEFARKVYDHWMEDMVNPSTFQVTDHIEPDGTKVFWRFSYNEGLMVGASVELYLATGEEAYLQNAHRFASFIAGSETKSSRFGSVLHDGTASQCGGDCHAFKGPAYRYLLLLQETSPRSTYAGLLSASTNAIWSLARSEDGLFGVDWTGPPPASSTEPQAAAAVMALNLNARFRGPFPGGFDPLLEAEEAAIRGVGLEATHGAFTGWGYVAGWNESGQSVTFAFVADAAGTHDLTFRHAGGAGGASRRISVNGSVVAANLAFPGTGSWESYAEVSLAADLRAGRNTIEVAFSAAAGSANWLNLDHLRVRSRRPIFLRGDANADGGMDLSDAITVLLHLFGGRPLECIAAADADGGGSLAITDAVVILDRIFRDAPALPPPYPECGAAPSPGPGCEAYAPCW